jgi:hypothetical protein
MRLRLPQIALAITLFQRSDLQSPQVFSERVTNQCRTIPLRPARGPISRLQELRIKDDLDGFHS